MRADLAMYQAKRAGGGSWQIFDDSTTAAQAITNQADAAATPAPASGGPPPRSATDTVGTHVPARLRDVGRGSSRCPAGSPGASVC
jgi:hypothetical protein